MLHLETCRGRPFFAYDCYPMRGLIIAAFAAQALTAGFVSARYKGGSMPVVPPLTVSGGEVWLEALVAADGGVTSVEVLRTTPPLTEAMLAAIRGWHFQPAATGSTAVASHVLVAGMLTPPALNGPTLGAPPKSVGSASDDTPRPTVTTPPTYPLRALGNGIVLVEVTVRDAGPPADAHIVLASPPFDGAALAAARSWKFEPARRNGRVVTTRAYLLFVFRQPVT